MTTPDFAFESFAARLPPRGTLIGLDLGTKTIGVAASDPDRRMASPVETIRRVKFTPDVERLLALAAGRTAVGIVIGLPLNMDDSEGPRAQSTRAFARNLATRTALPIGLWDERLSTFAAAEKLAAAGLDPARHKAVIDQYAAAHILQEAIDRLASGG